MRSRVSELVDISMNTQATPAPLLITETPPPPPEDVTTILKNATSADSGDFAALIGGIIGAVLLVLICTITVLMWCLTRHKGSYVTNEMDGDDDDDDDMDIDESVGSDVALQAKAPLKIQEDE